MSFDWYFTAPWDPVPIRRGDALGFRAGADYFADLIAPGLSNATVDARWITLLSWCLKWSHIAWQNSGGGDLSRRDDQRARYAWLRPLELLWIDRTLASGQTSGQLRGRRSLERWQNGNRKDPDFAMTADQFRRYRQVGIYGAYRVIFRTMAGLTTGNDGWTPDKTAMKLADIVNNSLPAAVKIKHFDNGTRWSIWRDQEARFWTERGWDKWRAPQYRLLPTPNDARCNRLPEDEGAILRAAIFHVESIRLATAKVLSNLKKAQSHVDLCDALAASEEFDEKTRAKLAPLPAFSRLADAAMEAMRALWIEINRDGEAQAPTIEKLVRLGNLEAKFEHLRKTSEAWLKSEEKDGFPHAEVATRLAEAMLDAALLNQRIRALTKHHAEYGGGRRWFQEQGGALVPLVADTGIAAADYRFRLRSICLLAAQCRVANMDKALNILLSERGDDENGDDE